MGIAVLGMYDFPELRSAWDELYCAAASQVDGAPVRLTRDVGAHDSWLHPQLALGMACGWPLVKTLGDQVRVVGTFAYAGTDGPAHMYRSVIVARADHSLEAIATDPSAYRAALNSTDSLSGNISLLASFGLGVEWPGAVVVSGSHAASIDAVRTGAADVAAIDGMTWLYRVRDAPRSTAGVRVIGHGPLVPCLPLIVPASASDARLDGWRDAFMAAVADPAIETSRRRLLIDGFVPLDARDYATALAQLTHRHLQPA